MLWGFSTLLGNCEAVSGFIEYLKTQLGILPPRLIKYGVSNWNNLIYHRGQAVRLDWETGKNSEAWNSWGDDLMSKVKLLDKGWFIGAHKSSSLILHINSVIKWHNRKLLLEPNGLLRSEYAVIAEVRSGVLSLLNSWPGFKPAFIESSREIVAELGPHSPSPLSSQSNRISCCLLINMDSRRKQFIIGQERCNN